MRFIFFLFLLCASVSAQTDYPKDYFRQPLDIPLQLSGNFGELRSNHFHAGFDFRTQQKEGLNVYAAADGYVSRIRISTYGYGKAIYITHPNGYTTVYGHLKHGAPAIERYIKAKQYELQSFDLDYIPAPTDLPVTKGSLIALSGNTGGSDGPHLHFEIRETLTEKVINPMYFGFDKLLPDTKKPAINNIVVYPIDEQSVVNNNATPIVIDLKAQEGGGFIAEKISASGRIGFGINATDRDDHSHSPNGLFEVGTFFNGSPTFGYKFETFHFDESRYINALIDYPRYKRMSQRVQKLFMKQPFPLSIIKTDANNGIIDVIPNMNGVYRIEVSDFKGNKNSVSVPIVYVPPTAANPGAEKTPYFLEAVKDNRYEKDNASVFFPAGTFYEDFYLDFDVRNNMLILNNKHVPAHNFFTVSIAGTVADEKERSQTFLALVDGTKKSFNATTWKDGIFSSRVRALGNYALVKDTVAPVISIGKSIEGKWISSQKTLSVYIRDDLSGIKTYNGWLNGKWILFEYEYKTRKLTHNFDDNIFVDGRNELKVEVTDNVGNSAIFETHFFRSQQ